MRSFRAGRDAQMVLFILILAGLHGVIYLFLIPPWQHYDEPNHFEVAWLTAHLERFPKSGDTDPKLNRQVMKSMLENGFFDRMSFKPVISPPPEKIQIFGYSQLTERPLYYLLASIPLRIIPSRSIDAQLYTARAVSLLILLFTVLASWGIACELVPKNHPLRWMLPLTLALTPAFVDLMTAVNNDSLAVGISSAFFWLGVRLIRRGFSWPEFIGLTFAGLLAVFIKSTAMVVLLAYPAVLLFALLRAQRRKFAWIILCLGLVFGAVFVIRWDDARAWYRSTAQSAPTRKASSQAVVGRYVFDIQNGVEVTPAWNPEVFQHLPGSLGKNLAGKFVTLGYWIWSDQAMRVRSPSIRTVSKTTSEEISLSKIPVFYAFQVRLPEDTDRIWIDLAPQAPVGSPTHIYYDGLLLVEGRYPVSETPQFDDPDALQGSWGGVSFVNLLRNGSAELSAPRFSSWIDQLGSRMLPDRARPSLLLASLVDPAGTLDLYPVTADYIFQTFWARFGWGHVPLQGAQAYQILQVVSLIGLGGAILAVIRCGRLVPWDVVVTMALVVIPTLVMAVTRGGAYLAMPRYYYAPARYIFPVIIPLMLLFTCGWLEIFRPVYAAWLGPIRRQPLSWRRCELVQSEPVYIVLSSLYLVFFLALSWLSIVSIAQYYGKF